jgi:hypothetical protein
MALYNWLNTRCFFALNDSLQYTAFKSLIKCNSGPFQNQKQCFYLTGLFHFQLRSVLKVGTLHYSNWLHQREFSLRRQNSLSGSMNYLPFTEYEVSLQSLQELAMDLITCLYNQAQMLTYNGFNFNTILPPTPRFTSCFMCPEYISYQVLILRLLQSWFDHPNTLWRRKQITNLIIMKLSPCPY